MKGGPGLIFKGYTSFLLFQKGWAYVPERSFLPLALADDGLHLAGARLC